MAFSRNKNLKAISYKDGQAYYFTNAQEKRAFEAVASMTGTGGTIFDNNVAIGDTTADKGGTAAPGTTYFNTRGTTAMPGGAVNGLGTPVVAARLVEDLEGVPNPEGSVSVMTHTANNNYGPILGFNVNRFFTTYPAHGIHDANAETYFTNGDIGQILVRGYMIMYTFYGGEALPGKQWVTLEDGQRPSVDPGNDYLMGNDFEANSPIVGHWGTTVRQVTAEEWAAYPYFTEDEKANAPADLTNYHLVYVDANAYNQAWIQHPLYVSPTQAP